MRILDSSGDTVVQWSELDDRAVLEASRTFDAQRKLRRMAFARLKGAAPTESVKISSFDPSAEEIIFVRPIAGG